MDRWPPMRVLLLAQFYPPVIGGEERHVRNLALALAGRGHDVHVGTLRVGAGEPPVDDPGVTVHLLDNVGHRAPGLYPTADRPLALPVPDPLTTRDLAGLARRIRPDVVHSHNWILGSWLPVPGSRRLPLVHSLHDYSHACATKRLMFEGAPCAGPTPARCLPCTRGHYGSLRGPVMYGAVRAGRPARERRVDVFTPVSRFVAEANGLPESGVDWEVVPNFVPDALLGERRSEGTAPGLPGLPGAPYLFFAGDLSQQKGVPTLLDAWSRLPADRPDLLLAGRPDAALPAPLPAGVHVAHSWPHESVVAAFQGCLAAALPSEWPDPCPTTVLEAMALGAPLVTTHEGGIADMVEDGDSALVVPPGDPAALARALARLVEDRALRARLRAGAAEKVRGFVQSEVAARFEGIYASLASGERSAR
ncbi:glycosyltransferase family 4 protein [Nocardioides donggukensis]|uniref:Glycosyltransferase family 4 protein n=1 Tax=Nocardioides donggukensis TaxID=2774019 RepID=A0A927K5A3_9ACTN|nr:glycosyltransferase family 4 protein [Nocardioides donggukensis]MBD8869390.1 glycosyltransferase family 4 protein [Nocardioides donggukensis]